jgi:hypothetical protein
VPYVVSIVLLMLGLVLMVAYVLGVLRALGRFRSTQAEVTGHFQDRVGLLKARTAGVRVAIADRFPRSARRSGNAVDSGQTAERHT